MGALMEDFMDRFTSMSTFVQVVDSGTFSAAARRLELSPAAVTSHVQALEQRLGLRLLNRTTRRVSLTEEGTAFHRHCTRADQLLDYRPWSLARARRQHSGGH